MLFRSRAAAAGLGVSIVPASMQRLRGDGIVYRELTECQSLVAPLHLATRIDDGSAVLGRFKDMVVIAASTDADHGQ